MNQPKAPLCFKLLKHLALRLPGRGINGSLLLLSVHLGVTSSDGSVDFDPTLTQPSPGREKPKESQQSQEPAMNGAKSAESRLPGCGKKLLLRTYRALPEGYILRTSTPQCFTSTPET
ncbi:Copper-Transporting Atpase 1 [Manis pentadactyla]|nr:Copper-Transporting Atpase 1 [Manis pentadactyla]